MDSPLRDKLFVGRHWVFERLFSILDSQSYTGIGSSRSSSSWNQKKPVNVLVGTPGCGKTAVLTEMCFTKKSDDRVSQVSRRVLAHHFAVSQSKRTLSLTNFITNLIAQISKSPFLLPAPNEDLSSLDSSQLEQDPDEIFRRFVLSKLIDGAKTPDRNMYLVIDGIDESYDVQLKIGETSSGSRTIAELLAAHIEQFPPWLHLLCSTRRQSKGILKMFPTLKKISLDDYKKDYIVKDFKQYMQTLLLDDPSMVKESYMKDFQRVFEILHDKSSGCFLYLELIIQSLATSKVSTRELKDIPGTLSGLYSFLCHRLFRNKPDGNRNSAVDFSQLRPIFAVFLASQTPMTRFDIMDSLVTKNFNEPYDPEVLELQLQSIEIFLWKDKGLGYQEQCLQLFHHSFAEWLTDIKSCGRDFLVNVAEGHMMLALTWAYFWDLRKMNGYEIYDIIHHMSQAAHSILMPPLNAELLALWVLWVGLEPDKVTSDGVDVRDPLSSKIISLASTSNISRNSSSPVSSQRSGGSLSKLESSIRNDPRMLTEVDASGQTVLTRHLAGGGAIADVLVRLGSDVNHEDMSGASPLIVAVKCGNADAVRSLLKYGAEVDHRDYEGCTALRAAAWEGFFDIVSILLEARASVDLEDNDLRTPLRAAAWQGYPDIARKLIECGANVNKSDGCGQTPLNAAAYMGHCGLVDLLLCFNADIDQTDNEGRTALTIATLYEQCDVAKRLLAENADINHQDNEKVTPLIAAAYKGNLESLGMLLDREDCLLDLSDNAGRTALLAAVSQGHLQVAHQLILRGADCDLVDPDGRSVLSIACSQGNPDVVRLLLDNGYDQGSRDHSGWTPLHVAAFEGHAAVCDMLIRAGMSPNDVDDQERSPLILAAQEGHLDVVQFLISKNASLDHLSAQIGQNALRAAALEDQTDVVEFLLTSGSNIDLQDKDGRTALYVLAQENKLNTAKLFIEWQAKVDVKDLEGRSPLMVAAWQGHQEMCQLLIAHGADINCTDIEARSVLQMAAWQGNTSIVKLLCHFGANTDSMCSQGATALTIASQEGHADVMEVLLEHGADPLIQDKLGRSAYMMAISGKYPEVKAIMEKAVSVSRHTNSLSTLVQNNRLVNQQQQHTQHMQRNTPSNSNSAAASPVLTKVNAYTANHPASVAPAQIPPRQPIPPAVPLRSYDPRRPFPSQSSESACSSLENKNITRHNHNVNQPINDANHAKSQFSQMRNDRESPVVPAGVAVNVQPTVVEGYQNFPNHPPRGVVPAPVASQRAPPVGMPVTSGRLEGSELSIAESMQQHSLKRNQRFLVNQAKATASAAAVSDQQTNSQPKNNNYIYLNNLQKSILLQAQRQDMEDRAKRSKKRKKNLFAKIHNLLKFGSGDKNKSAISPSALAPAVITDDFTAAAFSSQPPTPNIHPDNNQFNFSQSAANANGATDHYKKLSNDNTLSDKKSADYRRLIDLSHLRNVDPLTSRSFRNYDRLGLFRNRMQQQYASVRPNGSGGVIVGNTSNLPPSNAPPMLPPPRKNYYITHAAAHLPSRPAPKPPSDPVPAFQARSNRPPEIPARLPKQNQHIFEHVGGVSKVVAENPLSSSPQVSRSTSDYWSTSSQGTSSHAPHAENRDGNVSGSGYNQQGVYVRNYINHKEMLSRSSRMLPAPTLETIQEPIGGTLEAMKAARLESIPNSETII